MTETTKMSSDSKHSRFAPSASKRWIVCPGSATLEAQRQDNESSVYAQWGSAAHQLGEMRLKRVLTAPGLTQCRGKKIKEIAPLLDPKKHDYLDIVVDEEMIDVVQEYVLYCESLLPKGVTPINTSSVAVEHKAQTSIDKDLRGTVDFLFAEWPMTLHVVDLKGGAGHQVEAVENSQLAIYALGALEAFGSDFETVRMVIFQPRGDGDTIRVWEVPTKEFQKKWTHKLHLAVERAKKQTTTYVPGDHCKWCKGALVCPNIKRTFTSMTKRAESNLPAPIDPKQLSKILNSEVLILEFLNQCKDVAFKLINRGIDVPGFKLVQTWGRTKWTDEEKVFVQLSEQLGGVDESLCVPTKLRTPAQIKKELGKRFPFDKEEMKKLTTTPNNGAKLVPETDKRPRFVLASEVFSDENNS